MEKYGVVIDSTNYLSEDEISKYGIKQVSLNVIDKDETYKECDITCDFVYNKLDSGHKLTTSQPSPGEFLDVYEELFKNGYEKVFVIVLSQPLSGTLQSAMLAKKMLDNPEKVHIFESNMAAFGNEMLTLQLIEMIENKKSEKEIINRINNLLKTSNLIFTIENMISLYRSGRLSKTKAAIGTVMRIKPLIQMVNGKLDLFKSARTHNKVIEGIITRIKETTQGFNIIHVRILSHNSLEQARMLEDEIKKTFTNAKITFNEYLGPIFSLHLGKRGYGVAWCNE